MRFVPVDKVPGRMNSPDHPVLAYLDEFMAMNEKVVRVELDNGEYLDYKSCYSSFCKAVRNGGYPVKVTMSQGIVYLQRKDML